MKALHKQATAKGKPATADRLQARPARQVPAAPNRKLPPLERAGDWVTTNQWIGVGLFPAQVKILTLLGKHWRFKQAPTATAARMLLCAAMADLPRMERRLAAVLKKPGWGGVHDVGPHFHRKAMAFLAERGIV